VYVSYDHFAVHDLWILYFCFFPIRYEVDCLVLFRVEVYRSEISFSSRKAFLLCVLLFRVQGG